MQHSSTLGYGGNTNARPAPFAMNEDCRVVYCTAGGQGQEGDRQQKPAKALHARQLQPRPYKYACAIVQ